MLTTAELEKLIFSNVKVTCYVLVLWLLLIHSQLYFSYHGPEVTLVYLTSIAILFFSYCSINRKLFRPNKNKMFSSMLINHLLVVLLSTIFVAGFLNLAEPVSNWFIEYLAIQSSVTHPMDSLEGLLLPTL